MNSLAVAAPDIDQESASLFDPELRPLAEIYKWLTSAGLRGANAEALFDGYCQRLVWAGVRLLRGHVSTRTLHPQWRGYGFTWRRETNSVRVQLFAHGGTAAEIWVASPFFHLIERARAGELDAQIRRRLEEGPEQRDFPALVEFHAEGATDYFAAINTFGETGDPSQGEGVVTSFTTDAPGGFAEGEIELIQATLPALALALKSHAGHEIASNLLRTYLGEHAGQRVHSGSVRRGVAESLQAALLYADVRGFTRLSDILSGAEIMDMLDDIFEAVIAPLRPRGGHVLKFIGDAVLAIFPFEDREEAEICRIALDAAEEALASLTVRGDERRKEGRPFAEVDIALHVGEVLYGNFGAVDRLDFTAIGPAVNEVTRLEKLCEPLGRHILMSDRFANAARTPCGARMRSLGTFTLRGVGAPKEVFGCSKEVADPVAT